MIGFDRGRLARVRVRWQEINGQVGAASPRECESRGEEFDPARFAELLDRRAAAWLELGAVVDADDPLCELAELDVYAVACHYAAELDRRDAARTRVAADLPSPYPHTEAELAELCGLCAACGRRYGLAGVVPCPVCAAVRYVPGERGVPGWALRAVPAGRYRVDFPGDRFPD